MSEKEEDAVVLVSALVDGAVALAASSRSEEEKQKYILTNLSFDNALYDHRSEGWFTKHLRCSRSSFREICGFLRARGVRFAQATIKKHSYEKKCAAALYFFASVAGYSEVADAVGMAKSYVIDIVDEVVRVLYDTADDVICFPSNQHGWDAVESDFARRCGYPGVVGAADGSLLAIQRPKEFDGFYCRKCYPALNMQAIVAANRRFMSIELRPGSWSDKKCWKFSYVGQHVHSIIPAGSHFIGDAGYALLPSLIVPYAERGEGGSLTAKQHRFNTLHSSTRMSVECTFGLWKGRFRYLQKVLDEKSVEKTVRLVTATVVLHNVMVDLQDNTKIKLYKELQSIEVDDTIEVGSALARKIGLQKRNDIADIICH
uniref:DDE Tnp4 domain-containing protein n=1 Tax=Phytophthora fragariae TaxID=53985 RepID=A0A6A3DHY2_9STRA|nr:hypothetical protein PF009_g30404 [Phytophthora fragariae]